MIDIFTSMIAPGYEQYYQIPQKKAILFDSGKVLNRPVSGHWFITPNFFRFVDKTSFFSISKAKRYTAFKKAGEYLSRQLLIRTEEDEYLHFVEYYRILFENLPELKLIDTDVESIAGDLVFNYDKYSFYNEVYEAVPWLSQRYKLAVVSDAWPSLENVFKKAGLRSYFGSFAISSFIGAQKPDEIMYTTALKELGVLPHEAVFVDDNVRNCDGAKKLGISTFLLCRDLKEFLYSRIICREHRVIRDIRSLYDIKL